jgi:pyrroloquinoline quinone biosynthesis protein E
MTPRPYTLVAELSYRCPLACPYCSNPATFADIAQELPADAWGRVFAEARELGVVQVHLTGGEPLVRDDLETVVALARQAELYVNLVTSAVPFERERVARLLDAGVDHVQLSLQAPDARRSDRIAGRRAFDEKLDALRFLAGTGTAVTLNVVLHRENVALVDETLELALELGISKVELAHAQYLGFALRNREALLPSAEDIERTRERVRAARRTLEGRLEIVHVLPDLHAGRPKACMDGWGRRYVVVAPDGVALPCHAARSISSLAFENVAERPLAWIWRESASFRAFRGEAWMKEPCRSCEHRVRDYGGCRCQAFALTGDATETDPACSLAPAHGLIMAARRTAEEMERGDRRYLHRSPRTPRAALLPRAIAQRNDPPFRS